MRCASPPASVAAARFDGEVVETDVDEEPEPFADLLEDAFADLRLALAQLELADERRVRP